MERAHRVSRLACAALVTVLLLLVGVAIASAFVTRDAARNAAAAATRADLFETARFQIGAEESLERKYRLEPSPAVLDAHRKAGERLEHALQIAKTTPGKSVDALVDRVLAQHHIYFTASRRMFAAVDAHNQALVSNIDQQTESIFSAFQTAIYDETTALKATADSANAALLRTESTVLVITLTASFVGITALYGIFTVLRRYKSRVDDAIAKEIELLREASLTDYLTGLGNHRAYQESFRNQTTDCRSSGNTLTLALVDVDELKVLNDRHGHVTGDRVLASLAKILRSTDFRAKPFRLGGDEFALTCTGMPMDIARARMEEVRALVEAHLGGTTVSIGLATMTAQDDDPLVLREQADAALYEAKRRGRNSVVSFDDIRAEAPMFSPARVAQVRELIETGVMGVALQPIWNLEDRTILAYEALARPAGDDPINPQDAFDIAENIGKAHELDQICRDAILRKAKTLPPGPLLFINVHPQSLDHEAFQGTSLLQAVALAGLTPSQIVLEITERSVARLNVVVREAKRLRALGFSIALDDAGSGNSGLEMLSQLDVDYVKIDRDVIVRAQSGGGRAVLAGIVAIAHEMGAQIIAEGIEDAAMLDLVRSATRFTSISTAVQGYFLGRPGPNLVDPSALALVKRRLGAPTLAIAPQRIYG